MRGRTCIALLGLACGMACDAAVVSSFEDVPALAEQGWVFQNNSDQPWTAWRQGNSTYGLSSYGGGEDEYLLADWDSTKAEVGTISNWIMTPELTMDSTSSISFYTSTSSIPRYPDRLQVRLSMAGASTDVGSLPTDVGDFTELLLDINPTYTTSDYPSAWTQYQIPLTFLADPISGRVALRYFVEDGGLGGTRSDKIGVDNFVVTPEPAATTILLGVSAVALRRRRGH